MSYYSSSGGGGGGGGRYQASSTTRVSLNALLSQALESASNPGVGDEEPEVMADPNQPREGDDAPLTEEEERMQRLSREAEQSRKALEEEERRVAALHFDPDFVLPTEKMRERSKYIPLRLTYEERKSLRLVNAAISVSDYTNVVDKAFTSKARRQHAQLQQVVAFLSGVVTAVDHAAGQQLLIDRNFAPHEKLIQDHLEIARRYKITNPEKMRSEYGKLVYLMQDACCESIKELLGIDIHKPIKTVYSLLEDHRSLDMLDDQAIGIATEEILAEKDKSRYVIENEIKRKEKAQEALCRKYSKGDPEILRRCLYSIGDNNSFLNSNKRPVTNCITLLRTYFSSADIARMPQYALNISEGHAGARLSHSHETQFEYVLQSLSLWEAILNDMFRLWYLSEQDLLNPANVCEMRNTGQGLQRVQPSPLVYQAMHEILARTKRSVTAWVGSSVIHLGDNNVPNALVFIDKYTQVARILGPLVSTLRNLDIVSGENEGINRYLDNYGGLDKAKMDILVDFFRFAFDGSGGDNFFEAGSCIDGRLTSAWNWCSQLANKPYYLLFKLTGFLSFDGEFDK